MVLSGTNRPMQRVLSILLVSILAFAATPATGGDAEQDARAPYSAEHRAVGFIGCSASYWIVQGRDLCDDVDSSSRSVFDFPLDARVTSMIIYLETEDGPVAAEEFSVSVQKPVGIPSVRGAVPLLAQHTFDDEHDRWPSWAMEGQELTIDVRLNHDVDTPQVTYQQILRVCVGLFYNGAEVPAGYVPCQDA